MLTGAVRSVVLVAVVPVLASYVQAPPHPKGASLHLDPIPPPPRVLIAVPDPPPPPRTFTDVINDVLRGSYARQ